MKMSKINKIGENKSKEKIDIHIYEVLNPELKHK